ncbi:MAG: SURF1 family cytochrome oxidase biogenesis protein [Jatrophihabitans sp.]|uniref:SURF1 family cytochrome oxidase biogenesis protein n=1 Tax=Jatrophihabitans sp. TaxID=1932789 RepID=UPI00391386EA
MFRGALWPLRERRYRALAGFMALIAVVCAGLGTFEIHRLQQKRHDNGALRTNAHAAVRPLATALVPLVGQGGAAGGSTFRYRTVRVSGTYLTRKELYVDDQSQGGRQGFYALTPLRTAAGTLLVARGFVAATPSGMRPKSVTPAPTGPVEVTGWLRPAQTADDQLGRLPRGEITSVNPGQQSRQLAQPMFDAYLTLAAGQPGTSGLEAVPRPSLSNPTGGAGELQLLSYVVQWYAFMLLALAAPFLFARAEAREAQRQFLGIDPGTRELELPSGGGGRPALTAGDDPDAGSSPAAALEARRGAAVAERGAVTPQRWQRASRLADRYGRTLGPSTPTVAEREAPAPVARPRIGGVPDGPPNSAPTGPHRSPDSYHGSYNDYLWQLALADGELAVVMPKEDAAAGPRPPALAAPIDVEPVPDDADEGK